MAVATDSSDTQQIIFVADTGNDRILKLQIKPEKSPLYTWLQFKAALRNDDLDKAVDLFAEWVASDYLDILTDIRSSFQNMVDDMGDMILVQSDNAFARYDLLREEDGQTYAYPIFFNKDENGDWKISNF